MSQSHSNAPSLRTLRLLVICMILGSCVVGGTVLFSASRIGAKAFIHPAIGYAIGAIAVAAMIGQTYLVPRYFRRQKSETDDKTELLKLFAAETLTRACVLDAAALLAYLFYMFTLDDKILAVGVLLVAMLAVLIPTEGAFARWSQRS